MQSTAELRPYSGVRLKLAKEFTGFVDTDKKFRELAREAGVDITPSKSPAAHKTYHPSEIRRIIQRLVPNLSPLATRAPAPLMVFRMNKGGTGKTTMCTNVATCLAHFGYRVLVIDGDSQGSLSLQLGFDINRPMTHIGTILSRINERKATQIREAIVPVYMDGMLDLIPADITLSNESWMSSAMSRETLFTRLLEQEAEFFKNYDAVLVDCAPGTSMLSTAFIAASNLVTAVVMPEAQSVLGLQGLESNIEEINMSVRRNTTPVGLHVIANRYSQSYKSHNEALERLAMNYRPYLNDTIVRSYAGFLRETDLDDHKKSGPVLEKEPNSVGARDIIDVTKALIKLYNVKMSADPTMEGAT